MFQGDLGLAQGFVLHFQFDLMHPQFVQEGLGVDAGLVDFYGFAFDERTSFNLTLNWSAV